MTEPRLYIYTDFDGTITPLDLGDDLFIQYGDFEPYHSQLINGELHISEYWKILCKSLGNNITAEFIAKYAESQEVDAYFMDFVNFCKEQGFPIAVVSDGFDTYINPVLAKLGLSDIDAYCNTMAFDANGGIVPIYPRASESCDCLVASCKRNVLLANTPPDAVIAYIGDGYTDFCAAEHSDIVFAKHRLASYCFKNKIPHHTFKTFFDIKQILKKLIREKRIKVRHQAFLKRKAAFECE